MLGVFFCCRKIVNFSLDFPWFYRFLEENNKKSLTSCAMLNIIFVYITEMLQKDKK